MRSILRAQIGRANEDILRLTVDGDTVPVNAVIRVVFRFGSWCLDTDEDDNIELIDSATRVRLRLGLTDGLVPGSYPAQMTVFDAATPDGLAWKDPATPALHVIASPWKVCDADTA